ncbi:MAG: DUF2277 domain-containing protein [Deltaproteobacteria bacterium]|nr:DUF2277 domain-containing protein [Deltaproteobacteria bacterium]
MCRNIRALAHFSPPSTDEEIRAAALQYVRKVSGVTRPNAANEALFLATIERVFEATKLLVAQTHIASPPRIREVERERARLRNLKRFGNAK